jgi:hypothetical protein
MVEFVSTVTFRQESQLTPSCRDILVPKVLDGKILKIFAKSFQNEKKVPKNFVDFSSVRLSTRDEITPETLACSKRGEPGNQHFGPIVENKIDGGKMIRIRRFSYFLSGDNRG